MNVPEKEMKNPRRKKKDTGASFVTDDLGDITLGAGTYDLILTYKGQAPRGELFRPRAVILESVNRSDY